ncbi:uncharacterized protein LOC143022983 [Oratosquilla oratoria]|uniref:uncharacterized protein LOC143022983 n=1 Tax=Oratosquilla oratoria TaxID=337810 RepID=UPI003F76556A
MIHGPCIGYDESSVCCNGKKNDRGTCQKDFPKQCRSTIKFGNNGYPLYRRRAVGEGGFSFVKKLKGQGVTIDNSWVVPYNPYLCLRFNSHINVECSNSIKAIAYVTKYVNKGCDRVLFTKTEGTEEINEIKNLTDARFVNSNEATWKIFRFPKHSSYPPVMNLDLHLKDENEVFFNTDSSKADIKKKANRDTQLTAFFKSCSVNEYAATLTYNEVAAYFKYSIPKSCWEERKGNTHAIGRIRAVTNKTVELFYMRMLLTHKRGPKSFEDLRMVDGVLYGTYREAVKAMGLLKDEETWKQTILEIINYTNDRKELRSTYASMLVFSDLEDQKDIWEETKDLFSNTVRSKSKVALAVASSDIAATVLHGGRTAHNMFKIPLMEHNERKTCNIKHKSELARLLLMSSLIVWDEAVMANKNTISALDITLRDLSGLDIFMGGKTFVCAGDFRQILPVGRRREPVVIDGAPRNYADDKGKILGWTITTNGGAAHVRDRKVLASLGLQRLQRFKNLSVKYKKTLLYLAHIIRSTLTYPIIPLHTLPKTGMQTLQAVQKKALKFITNTYYPDIKTAQALHEEADIQPLNIYLHERASRIWEKLI